MMGRAGYLRNLAAMAIAVPLAFLLLGATPTTASGRAVGFLSTPLLPAAKDPVCAQFNSGGMADALLAPYRRETALGWQVQRGLATLFGADPRYPRGKDKKPLADGKIGPETKDWLANLCKEYPVTGRGPQVRLQVLDAAIHYAEIAKAVSDWKTLVAQPDLVQWVGERDDRRIRLSGSAPTIIRLLKDFLASGNGSTSPPPDADYERACVELFVTGSGERIPAAYLATGPAADRLVQGVQRGLRAIYPQTPGLDSGRIDQVTREALARQCREYPVPNDAAALVQWVLSAAQNYGELAAALPDWRERLANPALQAWLRGELPGGAPAHGRERLSGNAPVVAALLTAFPDRTAMPTPAPAPGGAAVQTCPASYDEGSALYYALSTADLDALRTRPVLLAKVKELAGQTFATPQALDQALRQAAAPLALECARQRFVRILGSTDPNGVYRLTSASLSRLDEHLSLPPGVPDQADAVTLQKVKAALKTLENQAFGKEQLIAQIRAAVAGALGIPGGPGDPNAPQAAAENRIAQALAADLSRQASEQIEYSTSLSISPAAIDTLKNDPLFVPFIEPTLKLLDRLAEIPFANEQLFTSAALSSVQTPSPQPASAAVPGIRTAVPPALLDKGSTGMERGLAKPAKKQPGEVGAVRLTDIQLRALSDLARKQGTPGLPAQLRAAHCDCAQLLDTVGPSHFEAYGFYPFWLGSAVAISPKEDASAVAAAPVGGPPIDFSVLSRIGWYAVDLDKEGNPNPSTANLWTREDGATRFVNTAHRYRTQVDLVVSAVPWRDWSAEAVGRAVESIDSLLDSPVQVDGVALHFPGFPRNSADAEKIVLLATEVSKRLRVRDPQGKRLYLSLVLDVGSADTLLKNQGSEFLRGLHDILVHSSNKPAIVKLLMVFLDEPTGREMQQLRLAIEQQFPAAEEAAMVLRRTLPILSPHLRPSEPKSESTGTKCNDDQPDPYYRFQENLTYVRDNFRGVAFWPLPTADDASLAVLKQRIRCTFSSSATSGFAGRPIGEARHMVGAAVCAIFCPNRQPVWIAILMGLGSVALIAATSGLSCGFRRWIGRPFPYLLLGLVLLLAAAASALIVCDPALHDWNIWILGGTAALLGAAWLVQIIRTARRGPLP